MSKEDTPQELRKQLIEGLSGGHSHIRFEQAAKDFPPQARGARPEGAPHSAWELLEHLRIAQHDILEFSQNPKHQSPEFPKGYWPDSPAPADDAAWQRSVASFEADRRAFAALLENGDLFAPLPHGDGQTLLREAIVLANHNSYHLGELVFLMKMLG